MSEAKAEDLYSDIVKLCYKLKRKPEIRMSPEEEMNIVNRNVIAAIKNWHKICNCKNFDCICRRI